jgi:hypothetical protein
MAFFWASVRGLLLPLRNNLQKKYDFAYIAPKGPYSLVFHWYQCYYLVSLALRLPGQLAWHILSYQVRYFKVLYLCGLLISSEYILVQEVCRKLKIWLIIRWISFEKGDAWDHLQVENRVRDIDSDGLDGLVEGLRWKDCLRISIVIFHSSHLEHSFSQWL